MSQTPPPDNSWNPQASPPVEPSPAETSGGAGAPPYPPTAVGTMTPPPPPGPPRRKRKLAGGWFFLGLLTPVFGILLAGALLWALSLTPDGGGTIATVGAGLLLLAPIVIVLLAFFIGLGKRDDKIRSYGLGGLVFYGAAMLMSLLLFGACWVSLGGLGR